MIKKHQLIPDVFIPYSEVGKPEQVSWTEDEKPTIDYNGETHELIFVGYFLKGFVSPQDFKKALIESGLCEPDYFIGGDDLAKLVTYSYFKYDDPDAEFKVLIPCKEGDEGSFIGTVLDY